jgi:HAD superfamily hydrolase (TIGR01459 family)
VEELVRRYDVFFLDAYGVLVTMGGALPGAAELLARLDREAKRWLLLSNDASRLPSTTVARYGGFGLKVEEKDVLTSGALLARYFARHGLRGAPAIVLGTEDSEEYVRRAGGVIAAPDDENAQVVVVADDDGYPFLPAIEATMTTVFRRLDRGQGIDLVLPNPDLIYPKGDASYGLASGSVALVLERALKVRYAQAAPRFVGLGKPHRPIFEAAMELAGTDDRSRAVMLGDQLYTDVQGANELGIDSALLSTGLTRVDESLLEADVQPTWLLADLLH